MVKRLRGCVSIRWSLAGCENLTHAKSRRNVPASTRDSRLGLVHRVGVLDPPCFLFIALHVALVLASTYDMLHPDDGATLVVQNPTSPLFPSH